MVDLRCSFFYFGLIGMMDRLLLVYFHACICHCEVTPCGKCLPGCVFQVTSSGKRLPGNAPRVATAMERVRKCSIIVGASSLVHRRRLVLVGASSQALFRMHCFEDSPPQKESNGKRHENNRNQAKIVSLKPIFLRNSRGSAASINRDASPINPRKP